MTGGFSELARGKEFRERVDKVCEVHIVKVYGIFKGTLSCLFWPKFRKREEQGDDNKAKRCPGARLRLNLAIC